MILYAYMCVCAFSLHRESSNMILGDQSLISEVVLSHRYLRKINPSFLRWFCHTATSGFTSGHVSWQWQLSGSKCTWATSNAVPWSEGSRYHQVLRWCRLQVTAIQPFNKDQRNLCHSYWCMAASSFFRVWSPRWCAYLSMEVCSSHSLCPRHSYNC
jgi:hypothetical protein